MVRKVKGVRSTERPYPCGKAPCDGFSPALCSDCFLADRIAERKAREKSGRGQ